MKASQLIQLLSSFKSNDEILFIDNNGTSHEIEEVNIIKKVIQGNSLYRNFKYGTHRNGTTEYSTWTAMMTRCENVKHKSYKDYGGRGIKICQAWRSDFLNFFRDMGNKPSPKHSLDRIDNDGDYCPNNCRWSTKIEQNNNTRACLHIKHENSHGIKGHILEIGF